MPVNPNIAFPLSPDARDSIYSAISDMSKDAQGFRLRLNLNTVTDSELLEAVAYWERRVVESIDSDRKAELKAAEAHAAHIAKMVQDHNISRATALKWDLEAMDSVHGDVYDCGYYCFQWGLSYNKAVEFFNEIKSEFPDLPLANS